MLLTDLTREQMWAFVYEDAVTDYQKTCSMLNVRATAVGVRRRWQRS